MENLLGKCSCIHCKEVKSVKGIFCHVDRAHLGANQYSSGNNGKYDDLNYKAKLKRTTDRYVDNKFGKKKKFIVICEKCKKKFHVIERENLFPSKEKYFCDLSCANSHIVGTEHRIKTSNSIKKYNESMGRIPRPLEPYAKICKHCSKTFHTFKIKSVFCSLKCANHFRNIDIRANRPDFINYRSDCKFRFNLKSFPDEFNFSLIEEFGWYKPTNHGGNIHGVSRDHMISVRYGFDNNIDPKIIAHPANCDLILQKDNSKKHSKCSITIDELLVKIQAWDEKYPP